MQQFVSPYLDRLINLWSEELESEVNVLSTGGGFARGAAFEILRQAGAAVRRDLDIEVGVRRAQVSVRQLTPPGRPSAFLADVFISHASEDKADVVLPLAAELKRREYTVWLDKFELKLGDRLREKIDEGLAGCRFGVVVLSQAFFGKNWPQRELAGLAAREDAEGRKIILPVWHGVDADFIASKSPTLAAVVGVRSSAGVSVIADEIARVLNFD